MAFASFGDEPLPAEWDDAVFQEQLDRWSIEAERRLEDEHLAELRSGEGLSWEVMRLKHPDLGKALRAATRVAREIAAAGDDVSVTQLLGIATDSLAGMVGPDATFSLIEEMKGREVVELMATWMRTSLARDRALLNVFTAVVREAERAKAERGD